MIQGNLFNKRNQRGTWSIVEDFFEVRIWIVFLSDVLIGGAICQDVLYSEGKSAIVACGSRIFSDKMNMGEAGMPNQ